VLLNGVCALLEHGAQALRRAEPDGLVPGDLEHAPSWGIIWAEPENQPHRADLAKMLVHQQARRRGVGAALLAAAEQGARAAGKTLLVLDTASDDAERLYVRQGWQRSGQIPNYALWPDGRPSPTTIYFKMLRD